METFRMEAFGVEALAGGVEALAGGVEAFGVEALAGGVGTELNLEEQSPAEASTPSPAEASTPFICSKHNDQQAPNTLRNLTQESKA